MKFLFNGWAHSVVLARHQVSGSFLLKNLRFLGYLLLKISFDSDDCPGGIGLSPVFGDATRPCSKRTWSGSFPGREDSRCRGDFA
jgi:hypothetical protein